MSTAIGTDEHGAPTTVDPVTGNPTKTPTPKVVSATVGAGVGTAVSVVGIYVIEAAARIDIPEGVELAIGVIVTAGLTFLSGYFKRP